MGKWTRLLSMITLLTLLSSLFPPPPLTAQTNDPSTNDTPPEPPRVLTVDPIRDPQLPSLSLHAEFSSDTVQLGEVVTTTLTLINSAKYPARDVVVKLPLPMGAVYTSDAASKGDADGWQWNLKQLAGTESITLTASFQVIEIPPGDALLLQAEASARDVELPIIERGGVLVLDSVSTRSATQYRVGSSAQLRSADGRVLVDFPADGFDRALALNYTPQATEVARSAQQGSYQRVFGAFSLDATDDSARDIHQFAAPLTLSVRYSPELLAAWNIAEADLTLLWFDPKANLWMPLPSVVDSVQQLVVAQVDHFSDFALGDGSSPSEAFIPSLQGFQVSSFTGAASYSYPIDVPAGPAGLKPSVALSYSSAATDGVGGQRVKQQAGWVGMGWTLDTGSVSVTKLPNGEKTYSLSVDGQSYDLVRGAALVGSPSLSDPTHWDWRPADETFVRVRVIGNGSSTSTRGGFISSTPYPRYTWQLWTKGGLRYDFSDDMWWGWHYCSSTSGDYAYMETSRWLLTTITDTHGNSILYEYDRDSLSHAATCFHVQGTIDRDIWPTYITWAGGRYRVKFVSSARTGDNHWEGASNQYGGINGQPRQTRRLDTIQVESRQASTWELIRQYNLTYDFSLRSDALLGTGCPSGMVKCPDNAYPRLTLKSIQRIGNDGTSVSPSALPATTFSYGAFSAPLAHSRYWAGGSWNRLETVNNGQGGTITLTYENVGQAVNNTAMDNQRRVTVRTLADGMGNSYNWNYSYGTPALNSLGTTRGPVSPWGADSYGPYAYPNSAVLYYNAFFDTLHNNRNWLTHKPLREFRGHSWVQETDPSGGRVKRYFHQGAASDNCTPTVTGGSITGDACFQRLRDGEFLKGKEYLTEYMTSGGTLLKGTATSFKVLFLDYTSSPLTGLWRAFSYAYQTDQKTYEGNTTPITSSTRTFYNTDCTTDTTTTVTNGYGNVACVQTFSESTLVRATKTWYTVRDDSGGYIVDRPNQEVVVNGSGQNLTITNNFYDNTSDAALAPTVGNLRRVLKIYDVPTGSSVGMTLRGQDSTFTYDSYGNLTSSTTYARPGTRLYNGSTISYSAPGSGSTTSTTTTAYDTIYHTFPISKTNALNHTSRAQYDYRMGYLVGFTGPNTPLSTTPTNCFATSYSISWSEDTTCGAFDVFGRLVRIVKPGNNSTTFTFLAEYHDTEIPFRYKFHQLEDPTTSTYDRTQQFYDGLGRLIQTKTNGAVSTQNIIVDKRYDGLDRVTAVSQPRYVTESSSATFSYTNPGSGSLYNQTSTTYDALGRPIRVTTPDGKWSEHKYGLYLGYTFDDVVDANRHRVQYRKDPLGRLSQVVEVAGDCGTSSFSWATCVAPYTTTWAAEATTTYAYDALDRLISTTDALGNVNSMTYDSLGRKLTTNDRDMGLWHYGYDANGQLVGQRDPRGWYSTFTYDALGRMTSLFNNDYATFIDTFDTHNTTDWTWSGHQTVPYTDGTYTVVRNVGTGSSWSAGMSRASASITSGKGVSLRFKVDSTNPESTFAFETGSGGSYRRFSVIVAGNIIKVQVSLDGSTYPSPATLINDVQVNTWYVLNLVADDVGGFTAQVYQENNPAIRGAHSMAMPTGLTWRFRHWTYRDTTLVDSYVERSASTYSYDAGTFGKGQRTGMRTPTANTVWSYDARGRQISAVHEVDGMTGTRTFSWGYDSADRLKTITYPAIGGGTPQTVNYTYDPGGRPASLYSSLAGKYLVNNAVYTALGQQDQWDVGNGAAIQNWNYEFSTKRLERIQVVSASTPVFDRAYAYDNVGNVKTITDNKDATNNQTYTYDHRDRLTSWTRNSVTQNYTYNIIGNLTSKTGVGSYTYPTSGATSVRPHTPSAVNGSSYTYDAVGNLTSGGGRTYTWSGRNLPLQVNHVSGSEVLRYNADGERIRKVAGSVTTVYLEGGTWEEVIGGATKVYYQFHGQTVAMYTSSPSAFTYIHGDHLGSAGLTTNGSGVVQQTQEYDPWGKVRAGGITSTDVNYTGQRLDISGLLYYNARMYDPLLARFISADTVVPGSASGSMDGVAVKPLTVSFHESEFLTKVNSENQLSPWFQLSDQQRQQLGSPWGPAKPQALNRYSYVLNNPMRYTDPTGHYISMGYEEALYMRELLRPLMLELKEIAADANNTIALATVLTSGLSAIISTLAKKTSLGKLGVEFINAFSEFAGGLLESLGDPTNAVDAYALLDFMNFQIEQYLFWVAGDANARKDERITMWIDGTVGNRYMGIHYNFDGPDGRIRKHNITFEKTFLAIRDTFGGAFDPPSSR